MKKLLLFLAMFTLVFMIGCGGDKKGTPKTDDDQIEIQDGDTDDADISDVEILDEDGDTEEPENKEGELYGKCYPNKTCNDGLVCDEEHDICIKEKDDSETPDSDTDNGSAVIDDQEAVENHSISGFLQAGSEIASVEVSLVECGTTEIIKKANTNAKGKFTIKADISSAKTYCVKANDFASCFKGMSDHVANISEITNAAYLMDKNCEDIRQSETKIRTYAKLGTGEWLGELDYSKLSGIREGLKLLSSFAGSDDAKTLSEKIAEDVKKDAPEFEKFFNGFKVLSDKSEIIIGESVDSNANFSIEGGSTQVASGFKINWTLKNNSAEAATYNFTTLIPGEYVALAKLNSDGGDPIMLSQDSATVLFLQRKSGGTVYVNDTSKNISFRIDDGIYGVIPKKTVVKDKDGNKINSISYDVLAAGGAQVSRLKFMPEGAKFSGDMMYFVHELGTVFGGDPIMLSATRTNTDGSVDVMNSAAGDPIMMAAAGDPIMTTAAGDPIMQAAAGDPIMNSAAGDPIMTAAAGDPIMTSAAGDPIMTSAAGDPIMNAAAGDPIMTSAAGDPIMTAAAGDPIMMGTSSSTMVSQTGHYSTFTVEAAYLPVSVDALVARWCDGSFYQGYSPIEFIKAGIEEYKPEGDDKTRLLSYMTCEKFGDLGNDLYELMNKQVGFQRNLNLFENLFFVSEFYKRSLAKQADEADKNYVAVKNGLELRSAIAALYTATTSYNRSSTLSDLFDSSKIPLTYSGNDAKDYTANAKSALTGTSAPNDKYSVTKKEMMIFANYITTSSKGPDFSSVTSLLTPDQLVCAWFNPETPAQNCNKVYTLDENGHVALGGTEVTVAEANAIFTKFFMPMNSRISENEKLDIFRTFYLALKYVGTIFYNSADVTTLSNNLLETAYLVFDGIDGNLNAVSITDTFDASAHMVQVLDGTEMALRPYLAKLSALTDKISLKVAAANTDIEKVLINIEGYEFKKVQTSIRTYYKPTGNLKEKTIVLTPGAVAQGLKPLKDLLGSENVDELGNITGKMTIVANSKIQGKTYTTQKTYDFFANDDSAGVNSKAVPANIQVFVNDSTGHAIAANANPTIILNPGNRVFYAENGVVSITDLTPAAYTIDAFADGYYAKNVSVNVPEGATFSVEIRLDEELTTSADANLELSININTLKHPSKVYIQIYNDDMDLVTNETSRFNDGTNKYETLNIALNSGRYTLLAVGEDMYKYLEAITLYAGSNDKEITVVAKNACGNGIVDSAEECEPSVEGTALEVLCGEIYPASTYPEKKATCNPATCTFNKTECGKAALCGDGILDEGEGCDGGSKDCSEIEGFGSAKGTAPCKNDDCSGYITKNNCSKTTAECGTLPENAVWNDGTGRFTQKYDGENWTPAEKTAKYGTTKDECVFSCAKGSKWNKTQGKCLENPLSLALICTGANGCFNNTEETDECPAYGVAFFGQDSQYAAAGFCTPLSFTTSGTGNKKIVTDAYTHYEWQAAASGSPMTWDDAETACANYEQENGGSTAVWRLPSPTELLTIVDSGTASPALNGRFTTYGHSFWAGENKKNTDNAWRVDENGALESVAKTASNSVICVRVHDYAAISNRFTSTDETVKDAESGLMWQKQAVASRTWAEALNYCEEVSTADKFDWRLPNRNELASLVDYTKKNGASSKFPGIAEKGFWTSTTSAASTSSATAGNEAWTVDFASGKIEAADKTNTRYIICVRNDEPCLGGECADPCSFNACKGMANSTGLCTANDYSFTCGCKSGFNWNHGKCLLATTRYIACEGLPENAVWNSVFGISQSLDGEEWYPSEVGTFNKIASTTECRFVCATNYSWDAENDKCLPVTRMTQCGDKKPDSNWNVVSKISQTWDGEKWVPSAESVYNPESSEDECRFICKDHYTWNEENKLCDPETQEADCTGLPANAHWWNESATITQTWTNGGWSPSATGAHSTDAEENRCFFACNENYEWNNTSCAAGTQTVNCEGLPDNAEWTGNYSSIKQTWNGSEWYPSEIGTYNTESNSAYCRFKCKDNYNWNGASCVAATRITACGNGNPPTHAVWNTASSIIQTYNGSAWLPEATLSYCDTPSTEICCFKCAENYAWNGSECVGATRPNQECTGLIANAEWWNGVSAISQTWNDTAWTPTTAGRYSASADNTRCLFTCKTNYKWDPQTSSCIGDSSDPVNCDDATLAENAHWLNASITQTWNGEAWLPTTAGHHRSVDQNGCSYECNDHFSWDGTKCKAATKLESCTGLPANTQWNTVSSIEQTWTKIGTNSYDWSPSSTASYGAATTTECHYTCKENYEWKNNECVGSKKTVECTGLPANAHWTENHSTVEQTWQGSQGWLPAAVGHHDEPGNEGCLFECNDRYTYKNGVCVGETRTNQNCEGLPDDNAVWNSASQISQTWNGEEWLPVLEGTYNETPSTNQCRFKCKIHFVWNGSHCEPETQIMDCPNLPDNIAYEWNTVSKITQHWDKNANNGQGAFVPELTLKYSTEATTAECRFKCKENYEPYTAGNQTTCDAATRVKECTGLPANAVWRTSAETTGDSLSITQRWNGSDWEQPATGVHGSYIEGYCRFACRDEGTHYRYEESDNSCVAMTRTGQNCIEKPDNSHWNEYTQIMQTYSGDGDIWLPTTTGSYSATPDKDRCYFVCDDNYEWNGTSCTGATRTSVCEGLPKNAAWNVVSSITQTYNGTDYTPSATAEYCENASTTNCCFKCLVNHTISSDQKSCNPDTRVRNCTALPDNAQWNTGASEGKITQTWNGSEWSPELTAVYSETPDPEKCVFKCKENYEPKNGLCVAKKEIALCTGLPANAMWNEVASIVREWQGSAWDLSTKGEYSEEPSKTECRFKCKENYSWDGSLCRAGMRVRDCEDRPEHSVWNEVAYITQTWNGKEWMPKLEPEYSFAPSTTECRYTCETGFYHVNGKCVADPCNIDGYNPCSEVENSDTNHTCTKVDNPLLPYSCECLPGFHWWGKTGCREKAVNFGNVCTGQDRCYNDETEITCPSEGEDFYGQDAQYADMGYCAPKTFELTETTVTVTDNEGTHEEIQKTVIDKNTGLEWVWEPIWNKSCDTLSYAGYNNWRVPSIKELRTIATYLPYSISSYVDEYFFDLNAAYSSNTEVAGSTTSVWNISLRSGGSGPSTTTDYRFLCVKGDELPESNFATINNVEGEPVIKDETTNLYWQKKYVHYGWRQGLAYCENLIYGGYDDWRVPNINELASIIDYTQSIPTVDPLFDMPDYGGDEIRGFSSTTDLDVIGMFYEVDFANGNVGTTWKGGILHCVRSDLCDAGTFWDGKNCAENKCNTDSCTMDHSNGICTPKNSNEFECGCVEGFRWDGSGCISDPCFDNKCAAMRGSDGICTAKENGKFECGCTEGYFWSISSCRKKAALGSICTGASVCIGDSGEIDCPSEGEAFYGQDANYAAKGACVGKSFTPATFSGEDVVIDNNTGLMWQSEISSNAYTFNQAVGYCSDLEYAGYSDWRLPNPIELQSIIEFGDKAPYDSNYFHYPTTPDPNSIEFWDSGMWSSLSSEESTKAYYVHLYGSVLGEGEVNYPVSRSMLKTNKTYVRCVRGDIMKNTLITWTENGKKLKVDTESGLMFDPNYIKYEDTWEYTWENALRYCEDSNYAGYTDWRLANVNEIRAFEDLYMKLDISYSNNGTSTPIPGDFTHTYWTGPYTFHRTWGLTNSSICVRSGNVPTDFPLAGQINTTCSEMVDCRNNCYNFGEWTDQWTDCMEECNNNTVNEAKYRYLDLYDCVYSEKYDEGGKCHQYYESGDTNSLNNCLLSACTTEFATCFANAGEGHHCLFSGYFSTDICYSTESVDIKTCFDLTQCIDSCGNDYSCQFACKYYSTYDALSDYSDMNYYRENDDYCAGAANFEGCMLYYSPYSYAHCYGTVDTSCSTLSDCMNSCNDQACKDRCRFNATETGNARYNALQQCRSDNNCGDGDPKNDDCTWDYCKFERAACYNSQSYTCGEFSACMNKCADDDSCKQACRERVLSSEVETQYNDLQECYSDFEESCNKESDPHGCLIDSCRTQYLMCFGSQYSGGFNNTCSDVEACVYSCDMNNNYECQQGCYSNADPEAVTLFGNKNMCIYNNGCMNYYYNGDVQGYFDCINTYCQNEYNACTASSSDLNTSCEEIIQCLDSCGSDSNCNTACQTNATLEASADFINLANCYNNCMNSGNYTECMQTNCSSEAAACNWDVSNLGPSEMDCGDLSTCVYNCNNDSSCIQTCYDNASLDGATQYDELNQCVANNNDSCQNEANPSDCLIAACQTEYNTCYGGGGSSGGTCDDIGTDLNCLQIFNECASSCNYNYNVCIQKGTPEAQTLAQNYLDCAYDCATNNPDDNEANEACQNANCMDEAQACMDN